MDPTVGQLTRGSEVRRARPLVADVLIYLAARPGEVVTKEALVAGPWAGAAIADSALTSTIAELRDLLDDQPKTPRYIETLPKRGYRLIAPVTMAPESVPAAAGIDAVVPSEPSIAAPAAATLERPQDRVSRWSRRSVTVAFVLGVIFAIVVGASLATRLRPAPPSTAPAPAMRLTIDLPPGVKLAPDDWGARLAMTPDGSRIAYLVRSGSSTSLYTRAIDQFESQAVPGTDGASGPFISPDGTRVGFFAGGELRTVPASGGQPSVVCRARVALGGSWAPDDTIVFSGAHGAGLLQVPASGGEPRQLTTMDQSRGEMSHRWPQMLPDGDHVLFTTIGVRGADVVVASRRTGERHVVVERGQAAAFVPPDRILFERDLRIWVAPIDLERFELTGAPRAVIENVSAGPGSGNPTFAAAATGAVVYVPLDPHETDRELVWVDRSGTATPLGLPVRSYMHPRLSADGRRVLTWMRTSDSDPWIGDVATRGLTRLATGIGARRAVWSPDGATVMFDARSADNPVSLFVVDTQGGQPRRLRAEKNSQYAGTWTPDGRTLVFVDLTKAGYDIFATANEPFSPRTPILNTPANETAPAFSPDGTRLAFVSDATGQEEVYVIAYAVAGTRPVRVTREGGREPVWSRRGDEIFFRHGPSVYGVRVSGARLSEPVLLFSGDYDQRPAPLQNYDVAADGRFLMIRGTAPSVADSRLAVLLRWEGR